MANNPTSMRPNQPGQQQPNRPENRPGFQGEQRPFGEQEKEKSLTEKAKDTAAAVGTKASEMASTAAEGVSKAASTVGEKADQGIAAVGSGMQSLAGTIRESAPHGGMLGTASSRVADTLDSGGRYLKEEGFSGMADEVTSLIRRNPIPAVLLALGIGFLVARSTRS